VFEGILRRLAEAFDEAGIAYMVMGGQAVLLYGEPRLTQDVDVTLGVTPGRLPDVLGALVPAGFRPLVDADFVAETLVLPCEDEASGVRVDVVFSYSSYEQEALQRTRRVVIDGVGVRFASVEDLLIQKVVAGRPRDLEDVRSVLLKHPALDTAYVRRWLDGFAEALDAPFRDLFDRLWGEAQP